MPKFRVTSPDGRTFDVNAPEGATQEDAIQYVQTQHAAAPKASPPQGEPVTKGGFFSDLTNPDPGTYYGQLAPIAREPSGAKRLGAPLVLQDLAKVLSGVGQIARGELVPSPENLAPIGRDAALQFVGGGTTLSVGSKLGPPAGSLAMNALPPIAKGVSKAMTAVAQPVLDRIDPTGSMGRILAKRVMQQNPGMSLEDAIKASQAKLAELGPQGVLADTGESLRGLADNLAANSGETKTLAKNILGNRDASEGSRMVESVQRNVSRDPFYDVDEAARQAKQRSGPFYERAYEKHPNVASLGFKLLLEQEPLVKAGINKGIELQRIEASTARQKFDPNRYGVVDFNDAGEPILGDQTPLRLWHAARKGLDAMIDEYPKFPNGKPMLDTKGKKIQELRKSFDQELKALTGGENGDFFRGDAIYADASKLQEALHRGRSFVNGDEEITADVFNALSAKEKAAYRAGVAREMIGMIRKSGTTPQAVKAALKDTGIRDKLKTVLPTESQFNSFISDLQREMTFKETNRVGKGSQTFGRFAEDEAAGNDAVGNVVGGAIDIARGNPGSAAARTVRWAQSILQKAQMPQSTRDRIGKLLLSQDPADKDEAFRILEKVKGSGWVYAP